MACERRRDSSYWQRQLTASRIFMPTGSAAATKTLHRELPSAFEHLEAIVEESQAFMDDVTDDDELAYRVTLLVSEAVTNAMEHGNQFDAAKTVIVDLAAFADRIELRVEDEGAGFEEAAVADPLAEGQLLEDRGRGLFLMQEFADEVHVEHGGRRLRLILHR